MTQSFQTPLVKNLDGAPLPINGSATESSKLSEEQKQTPYLIRKLEIKNFKGIRLLTVDANGGHVVVKGRNGSGKTSTFDGIQWILKGKGSGVDNPVRNGEHDASGTLHLDNGEPLEALTIARSVTHDGKQKLAIRRGGDQQGSQQGTLDMFLGKYTLDPIGFINSRLQDKIDSILQLCKEKPPVQDVHRITGNNHTPKDGETAIQFLDRMCADKTGIYYVERSELGLECNQKSKALAEAKERLQATPEVAEPPMISSVLQQISDLHALQHAETELAIQTRKVEELEISLCEAKNRQAVLVSKRHDIFVNAPQVCLADLKAIVNQNDERRRLFHERASIKYSVVRLSKEADAAAANVADADTTLKELRHLKKEFLSKCDFGVPELDVTEHGLFVGGVPIDCCSMAQQIDVAVAVVCLQKPRLGVIRIDEGERLDMRSRYRVFSRAEQHGRQVIITSVSEDAELVVEVIE